MKDALWQNARGRLAPHKNSLHRRRNDNGNTSTEWCNGSFLLRMTMVMGSLLLNPDKVVKSFALPVSMPTCFATSGDLLIACCRTNAYDLTASKTLPMVTENTCKKDSTWWLTRRLTTLRPRMDKSSRPSPGGAGKRKDNKRSQTGTMNKNGNNKKKDDNDTEWAITKLLIPDRLRQP